MWASCSYFVLAGFKMKPQSSVNEDNAEGETDGSRIMVIEPIVPRQSRGLAANPGQDPGCTTWTHARAELAIGHRCICCLIPHSHTKSMSCTIGIML